MIILFCLGFGAAAYKHIWLGFPLLASEQQSVWQVESRVTFRVAEEQAVRVNLNLVDNNPSVSVVSFDQVAPNYDFSLNQTGIGQMASWQSAQVYDQQILYLRASLHLIEPHTDTAIPSLQPMKSELSLVMKKTADALLADVLLPPGIEGALTVLRLLNRPDDSRVDEFLRGHASAEKRRYRAGELLTRAGYNVEPVNGVFLDDQIRSQTIYYFLELELDGDRWLMDPREMAIVPWGQAIVLQRSGEPLLEVFGGRDSKVTFATTETRRGALTSAVNRAQITGSTLIDFSIYSLPLADQNTFKLLLVIPLGALVVAILRNLIGIRTSGTFMPVLIALSFLQTTLLTGLMLFLVVVGVGLVLRFYLSHLNLLLVPRIASVLVFVIVIYAAIGISSTKLGWHSGLKVTFFPMIILAWTIERMSILWDEEGPKDVLIEGAGSLLTASLAYLLMSNRLVSDTVFLFPELLLVVLGVIISIGSYSGYRLSDLRRFEPMERHR